MIYSYNCIILQLPLVTVGSVNPAAIYVVYTIYNSTNNGVYIKYITKKYHINIICDNKFLQLYAYAIASVTAGSVNPAAHM